MLESRWDSQEVGGTKVHKFCKEFIFAQLAYVPYLNNESCHHLLYHNAKTHCATQQEKLMFVQAYPYHPTVQGGKEVENDLFSNVAPFETHGPTTNHLIT